MKTSELNEFSELSELSELSYLTMINIKYIFFISIHRHIVQIHAVVKFPSGANGKSANEENLLTAVWCFTMDLNYTPSV